MLDLSAYAPKGTDAAALQNELRVVDGGDKGSAYDLASGSDVLSSSRANARITMPAGYLLRQSADGSYAYLEAAGSHTAAAPLTFTLPDAVYGDAPAAATVTGVTAEEMTGAALTSGSDWCSLSGTQVTPVSGVSAGLHTAAITLADGRILRVSLTVARKNLTVTVTPFTRWQNSSTTAWQSAQYTVSGGVTLAAADQRLLTWDGSETAGTHDVTLLKTVSADGNYAFTLTGGTGAMTIQTFTGTFPGVSVTYSTPVDQWAASQTLTAPDKYLVSLDGTHFAQTVAYTTSSPDTQTGIAYYVRDNDPASGTFGMTEQRTTALKVYSGADSQVASYAVTAKTATYHSATLTLSVTRDWTHEVGFGDVYVWLQQTYYPSTSSAAEAVKNGVKAVKNTDGTYTVTVDGLLPYQAYSVVAAHTNAMGTACGVPEWLNVNGVSTFATGFVPASMTEAPTVTIVYGQNPMTAAVITGGTVKDDQNNTVAGTWSCTTNSIPTLGTANTCSVTFTPDVHGVSFVTADVPLTITPKTVTGILDDSVTTRYGTAAATVGMTVNGADLVFAGDQVTASAAVEMDASSIGSGKALSHVTVTAAGAQAAGYNVVLPAGVTGTVMPFDITASGADVNVSFYAGSGAFTEPAVPGVGTETVAGTYTYSYNGAAAYAAVKQALSVLPSGTTADIPYTFTPTDGHYTGIRTGTLHAAGIPKLTQDLTVSQSNGIYGSTLSDPQYTKPAGTGAATVAYEGANNSGVYYEGTAKPTEAGSYTAKVTLSDDTTVYYGIAPFNIAQRSMSDVTAAPIAPVTYTGAALAPAVTVTDGTLLKAGDYTVTYSGNLHAGTAAATVTALATGNYTGSISVPFTITPAVLTLTADSAEKTYGAADPALTWRLSGLLGTDTAPAVTGTLARAAGENAGSYAITQGTLSAAVTADYTAAFASGTLQVNKAASVLNASAPAAVMAGKEVTVTVTALNSSVTTPVSGASQPGLEGLTVTAPQGFILKTALHSVGSNAFAATYQIPEGASGEAVFTASYAGAANYEAAADSRAAVNVTPKNTVDMTLTPDKTAGITYGDSVTYTAAVSKGQINLPGDETLTGTVAFYLDTVDDAHKIAEKNITDTMTVTLDRTSLTGGTHSIIAAYSGNAQFASAKVSVNTAVAPAALTWNTSALKAEKTFDGGTAITVTGTLSVSGMLPGDDAGFTCGPLTGTLDSANEGSRTVTVTVTGAALANGSYALPAASPVISGTVTAAQELPAPTAPDGTAYRLIRSGTVEVPAALAGNPALNTPEKIADMMKLSVEEQLGAGAAASVEVFDVTLLYSTDGGKTWTVATADNFPAEGITVVLPYPEGTDGTGFNFTVTHMFTTGDKAGTTETLTPVKTDKGLAVVVHSLSPIAVGYTAAGNGSAPDNGGAGNGSAPSTGSAANTGDESRTGVWTAALAVSACGLAAGGLAAWTASRKRRKDEGEN